jgi:hypothetical protein
MRRFHNTLQLVDSIIKSADLLDLELATEFINFGIASEQAHLDLIRGTLSLQEQIRRERILTQGSILLALIHHTNGPRQV